MTAVPLFSAEISLYDDPEEGLRVECAANHARRLQEALGAAGFKCDPPSVVIRGTDRLADWVAFAVTGGLFADMKAAALSWLSAAGVTVSEENFSALGETHVRLNLANVSVFRP